MPDISLIIINYRSSALTAKAIETARATTTASLQVVVVDNSCDPGEADTLRSCEADDVIAPPDNLGYGGGANLGVRMARAPKIVVSNPDVLFGDACLDLLCEELREDRAITGPAFHWDEAESWLLPPAQMLYAGEKISEVLATRYPRAAGRRGRLRRKTRLRFWRSNATRRVDAVSGAVMAIDRQWFDRVGGFDERYELYFEEVDLMRMMRSRGGSTCYVPAARCRHLYNQSAGVDPERQAKFLKSETEYLRKWSAGWLLPLMSFARAVEPDEEKFEGISPSDPIVLPDREREWLVEASPLWNFDSAAGRFATGGEVRFPAEVWNAYHFDRLYLQVVDPSSLDVVRQYVMRK